LSLAVGDLVTPSSNTLVRSVAQATFHSRGRVREWEAGVPGVLVEFKSTQGGDKACVLLDDGQWWILTARLLLLSGP